MSFINIIFFVPNGNKLKTAAQLKTPFELKDFAALFAELFPDPPYAPFESYRFVVNGIDLNVQDKVEFEKNKHLIKQQTTIYFLQRCRGGTSVDKTTLEEIIRVALPSEMEKIPKVTAQCQGHFDTTQCISLCCFKYCSDCFIRCFKAQSFQLACIKCKKNIPYKQFFKSEDFIQTLESLSFISNFPTYIDCQICRCKNLLYNETMYSRQYCEYCKRWLCFFCNSDWNNSAMKNDQYTCHNDCVYELMITQTFIPMYNQQKELIPNKRICPKCFMDGGYGNGCQYNQCPHCQHWFCYRCLEPEETCKDNCSKLAKRCTQMKPQTYSTFPRLIKS